MQPIDYNSHPQHGVHAQTSPLFRHVKARFEGTECGPVQQCQLYAQMAVKSQKFSNAERRAQCNVTELN